MKINKPNATNKQLELESYVIGLLTDTSKKQNASHKLYSSKITPLPKATNKYNEQTKMEPLSVSNAIPESSSDNKVKVIKSVSSHKAGEDLTSEFINLKETKEHTRSKKTHEIEKNLSKQGEDSKNNIAIHQKKINQEVKNYNSKSFKELEKIDPRLVGVEKLLSKIALANLVTPKTKSEEVILDGSDEIEKIEQAQNSEEMSIQSAEASFAVRNTKPLKHTLGNVFQTLVFKVNQLPLAVPLVKLGGIVSMSTQDITPLVGTPEWFLGLVRVEQGNLMVVDTQLFLMPEKNANEDEEYRYLIILDNSKWALACHSVGDAKNILSSDIRWSAGSSKRPWFAGMVVEYMSALLEVDELINMLADNVTD